MFLLVGGIRPGELSVASWTLRVQVGLCLEKQQFAQNERVYKTISQEILAATR